MGTIQATTLEEFLDVIKGLVERGLVFETDMTTYEIKLTGGY